MSEIDMPQTLQTWMREIERRLRVQETAVRVPSLGSLGDGRSVQSVVGSGGVLASTGAVTREDLDGSFPIGVSMAAEYSGRTLIMFGASIIGGPTSADIATMDVKIESPSMGEFVGVNIPAASVAGPNKVSSSCQRYIGNLPAESGITITTKFSKTAGSWTAEFLTPYLIVLPI